MVEDYNKKIRSLGIDIGENRGPINRYANFDSLNNRLVLEQLINICILNGQEIARLQDKIDNLVKEN